MRLANHAGRAVIVTGDTVGVDVEQSSAGRFGPDVAALYEDWEAFTAWAGTVDASVTERSPLEPGLLGPPSPRPRQVFGIGLNYREHAAETGQEVSRIPATFTKFPTCITGPHAEVTLPSGYVDWEIELVVVIGRAAHGVAEDEAWSHVAGLTVGQDLSERVVQRAAGHAGDDLDAFGTERADGAVHLPQRFGHVVHRQRGDERREEVRVLLHDLRHAVVRQASKLGGLIFIA